MADIRFGVGLLNLSDAGRYLGIPQQTFHRWAKGYKRGEPLLHAVQDVEPRRASVSFITMAEAWVLFGLREAGVRPSLIRPALRHLQKEFGREYVLIAPELATDGISVLWDFSRTSAGAGLIEGHTGQHVIREIVQDYVQYLTWDLEGVPNQLTLRNCQPSKVVVDPYRAFGQPILEGTRTRLYDLAAMLKAGEDPEIVAEEHGVGIEAVRTAARVLLGRAA